MTRAKKIANLCLKYDICLLQEVWGPGLTELNSVLCASHEMNELCSTFGDGGDGILSEVKDVMKVQKNGTGGLFSCWNRFAACVSFTKMEYFSTSNFMSRQGILVSKLDVSGKWGSKTHLLCFNTHLTVSSNEGRLDNLIQIRQCLQNTVLNEYILYGPDFLSNNLGVVLCGDFNIDERFQKGLYRWLMNLGGRCGMRDLWLEGGGKSVVEGATLDGGDEMEDKGNSMCKYPGLKARIDYVFAVDWCMMKDKDIFSFLNDRWGGDGQKETILHNAGMELQALGSADILKERLARIETLWALREAKGLLKVALMSVGASVSTVLRQRYGEELSDHWGLSVDLVKGRRGQVVNSTGRSGDATRQQQRHEEESEESHDEEEEEEEGDENALPAHLRRKGGK
eukprot:GDKK01004361.1.p1 GENE.GDKK01004361.1~~GDKK01004361.1.p1  ORF type:complete len:447 (-),score=85.05 GDKK01004361.1:56-1249(-)